MVEMELTMGSWYNHISFCALKHWLGLKLLQNPRQDMEPLLQTFISGYYGPAAGKMREYLDYLERRVASVAVPPKISALKPEERPYLDFEFFVTSQQLLDEAETLCGADNPARLHVRAERIPVDASLYCLWDKLQAGLRAGKTLPFDQQTILRRYESTCLEQMNAFYGKTQLETGKKDLENKIKRLKEIAMLNRLGMLSK